MRKRPEGMEHLTDLIRHFNFTDIINDNDLLRCYDWNVNTSGYYVIKRDIYRKKKKSFRGRTIQGRYNYLILEP